MVGWRPAGWWLFLVSDWLKIVQTDTVKAYTFVLFDLTNAKLIKHICLKHFDYFSKNIFFIKFVYGPRSEVTYKKVSWDQYLP